MEKKNNKKSLTSLCALHIVHTAEQLNASGIEQKKLNKYEKKIEE